MLFLVVGALLPPPFPTSAFVIGAGVTRYPFFAFVLSFSGGRVCRFALLAYLASVFGRRFVTSMWSRTRWHLQRLLAVCWCVSVCWRGSSSGNLNRIRLSICSSILVLKKRLIAPSFGSNGSSRQHTLSAAARRKISLAQKARWAKQKARPRRTISAAGRRCIAAAQRARWAKAKRENKAAA